MTDDNRTQLLLAKQQLKEICESNKNDYMSRLQLAGINDQLEDLEGVIECCIEVLQINPDMPDVYYNLGFAFHRLGRADEASSSYQNAIRLDSSHVPTYLNLAAIQKAKGYLETALNYYEKVLAISVDQPEALYGCGVCSRELKEYAKSTSFFKRYIQLMGPSFQAYCDLGISLLMLGKYDDAKTSFDRALVLNPLHGGPYFYNLYMRELTGSSSDSLRGERDSVLVKRIDEGIRKATDYFDRQESTKLDFPYAYNYLQAKFGIKKLFSADIILDLIRARSESGVEVKDNFVLFYRLCDPEFKLDDSVLSLQAALPIDGITLQALYCDCWGAFELDDLLVQIESEINRGGYHLTHALIAIQWLKENSCVGEKDILLQEHRAVIQCVQLLLTTSEFDDLSIEALAILQYSGYYYLIRQEWVEEVLSAQKNDGGWVWDTSKEESNAHTAVLALWALLEYRDPGRDSRWVGSAG